MKHILLSALVVAVIGFTAHADSALADDNVIGKRWAFTTYDKEGEIVEENTFRATGDHKIYKGANEIGTWERLAPHKINVEITKGKMKGKMELLQIRKDSPTYRGPWTQPDGSVTKARVKLLED